MRGMMISVLSVLAFQVAGAQTYTSADVERALDDAERYQRDGQYAKSLERHLWYHENALKYGSGQEGVRLSFALSDWVELAHAYPKAMVALKAVRDKATAQYERDPGNFDAFSD